MTDILSAAHTLLIGSDSNFQGSIASELALTKLARGHNVIQLVDDQGEANSALSKTMIWSKARLVPADLLRGFHAAVGKQFKSAEDLAGAIDDRLSLADRDKPLTILRDLSRQTLPVFPGHPWLEMASALADILDAQIVTAASYGSGPAPNFKDYCANRIWRVEVSPNLKVELTPVRPSAGNPITFEGKDHSGIILWNEQKEPAHV